MNVKSTIFPYKIQYTFFFVQCIATISCCSKVRVPGIPAAMLSGGCCCLVGFTMANLSWVRGYTKSNSEDPYVYTTGKGGDPGRPISSYQNWRLGHRTSPLWWGRSLASVWGWEVMARYSPAHLNTWLELWTQSTAEGLDSAPVWSCPWWEAIGWNGYFGIPPACYLYTGVFPSEQEALFSVPSGQRTGPDICMFVSNGSSE